MAQRITAEKGEVGESNLVFVAGFVQYLLIFLMLVNFSIKMCAQIPLVRLVLDEFPSIHSVANLLGDFTCDVAMSTLSKTENT